MALMPGSNQYVGITSLNTVRASAALEAAGAWDTPIPRDCSGFGRVTINGSYTRGDAAGMLELEVSLSLYGVVGEVPAGDQEWVPVFVAQTEAVVGADTNDVDLEPVIYQFTPQGAAAEPFVVDLNLPDSARRVRVRVREGGAVGSPGTCALSMLLSIAPGATNGWMIPGAGSVAIAGAVTVNGAVDANIQIGDVDASAANPVPAEIVIECETTITSTEAASGDNQVVATPGAGNRIVVQAFSFQNTTAVATTGILRSGVTTNGWTALCQNQGDGHRMVFPDGHPWCLNENEALNLNLSGANAFNCSVMYRVETV